MKLEGAIEVHITLLAAPVLKDNPKVVAALELGIEAMKHVKDFRLTVDGKPSYLLPGETED